MAKYLTPRAIQRQKRHFRKKMAVFTFLFLAVIGLVVWFFNLDKLKIQKISVLGNYQLSQEELLATVKEGLRGKYLWSLPKDNFLIYPKKNILLSLQENFPQIGSLEIELEKFRNLVIKISERQPFAIWCFSPDTQSCYFMDNSGFLYKQASASFSDIYFSYIGGIPNLATSTVPTAVLRKTFLDKQKTWFDEINLFVRLLRDINIDGYELRITGNDNYELLFNNGSQLKFKKQENLDDLLENLRATLVELGDLDGQEFEYLDLRFANKVLYKFKD